MTNFTDGLRELADFLDRSPIDDQNVICYPVTYAESEESIRYLMSTFHGGWSKTRHNGYTYYYKTFGGVRLEFGVSNPACKRVKVGTRVVPATEARTEDVYEWQCPE